ncbi:MAG: hypothetical protein ACHQD7_04115 [Chitinophagales bacterium]
MRTHNGMRPQDIAVLIKMVANDDNSLKFKDISFYLHLSASEISESLNRSQIARLVDGEKKKIFRQSLMEFISHGLQYVFPAVPGQLTRGIATAHSHEFMKARIISSEDCVWPDVNGKIRGSAIEPLYPGLVKSLSEPRFYKMMALIDAIRVGKVRESKLAKQELEKMILHEPSSKPNPNKAVSNLLGPLNKDVVFVGGAVLSLYSDYSDPVVRPTDDVDVVIEIWNYQEYSLLDEKLRQIGFVNDRESGILCRYQIEGIILDVLPTQEKVLNFANRWYPDGHKKAVDYEIDPRHRIKIFPAPYFLAAKLEAFNDRGNQDGRTSSDFEDIVFLLEQRTAIWEEISSSEAEVRNYIREEFKKLLSNSFIEEWIESNVEFVSPPSTPGIMAGLKSFVYNRA